jgi:hypothetical protein
VRFSIFLCFFFRMRLRRFLINEPMRCRTLAGPGDGSSKPPGRDRGCALFGPLRWALACRRDASLLGLRSAKCHERNTDDG